MGIPLAMVMTRVHVCAWISVFAVLPRLVLAPSGRPRFASEWGSTWDVDYSGVVLPNYVRDDFANPQADQATDNSSDNRAGRPAHGASNPSAGKDSGDRISPIRVCVADWIRPHVLMKIDPTGEAYWIVAQSAS